MKPTRTSGTAMRIVVLQSCGIGHFLSAARAAAGQYPGADLVGLVQQADVPRARESGAFREVHVISESEPRIPQEVLAAPIDLCVVPFESRLGVYYWNYRRVPIVDGIPLVASYNRHGRLRLWSRAGWIANSLLVCVAVRAVHKPARRAWSYLRRWLDIATLFGLAGAALLLHGVRTTGGRLFGAKPLGPLPSGRRRVVLFIPSLGVGGTQRQLVSFLRHLDRGRWDPELVMLDLPDKFFEPAVRALNVPITYLNTHYDYWLSGVVWRLKRHLTARRPHVLHGWLHHAAALGAIAARLAGVPVVIGSLRSERPARFPWFYPKWQRGIDILTAILHTTVIANSQAVRRESRRWAVIPDRKLVTVYNGIDVDDFVLLDETQRDRLRAGLNLPAKVPLVGIVGRLWPEKDHATFLKAAALISRARPDVRFLIVGDGGLRAWIESEVARLGLVGKVLVLGERKDALALIQLLDALVLTSSSEGFPNVLLEAAAAGTPAVTTAAGGAAEVVLNGETGFVVPCGDAGAVAGRVLELLDDPGLRQRCAAAARERLRTCFAAARAATEIQASYLRNGHAEVGEQGSGRRLRVCFISPLAYGLLRPSSGLPVGGAEVQICGLAEQLSQDPRFEISVLTGYAAEVAVEQRGPLTVRLSPLFGRQYTMAGAPRTVGLGADGSPDQPGGWRLLGLVAAPLRWTVHRVRELLELRGWIREIRDAEADIYVMRCASPQVAYAKVACALWRRKLVYMVAHEHDVSGEYARAYGVWGRRFEWGLRRADAIVCQHAEQVGLLKARHRRDGTVIRSLCPTRLGGIHPVPRRTILWIARLDEWKQPELFLELARRMPEASFVMVASPSDTDPTAVSRLRARMDALRNLRWVSRVPFEDTTALFEEAQVFVNTSRAEGFPNTFLQAAACGTPIVSWAVNPERILDRYEIGYCAEQDWVRLEGYVRLLSLDEALRGRLGENGRRYVREHHDPAAIAEAYAGLLCGLHRGGPVSVPGPTRPIEDDPKREVARAAHGR